MTASRIPGVERRDLVRHVDARGALREVWRGSVRPYGIRQVLVTDSGPAALRGMHYHLRQSDLCFVSRGRVYMVLVDLRSDPPVTEEFWLGRDESLLIPPGVGHGYATVDGGTMTYLLSEEVDGSDEFGFRYDDPAVAIQWPLEQPILSERDRGAGTLAAAREAVRRVSGP